MNYNRNMPRHVVFGPKSPGGVGLSHLYCEQGSHQVSALLKQLRFQGMLGKTTETPIQWYQLTVGMGFSAFEKPSIELPHEVGEWLISVREFLKKSKCQLMMSNIYRVKLRRANDSILMEQAIELMSAATIPAINRCRLFLQVETVANISTA